MSSTLDIWERLATLQGETSRAGYSCWLIRLAGCPLSCSYCDTPQDGKTSQSVSVDRLVDEARRADLHHVVVTGGEPLAQKDSTTLLRRLCDEGHMVALETSGALSTADVDRRVSVVIDIKCPSSGMSDRMNWNNLDRLAGHDEVKFVVANRDDYTYARQACESYHLPQRAGVLLSPVAPQLAPEELAQSIVADKLPARLQVQLHRLAWPNLG